MFIKYFCSYLLFIGTCPQGNSFAALSRDSHTESGVLLRSVRVLADEDDSCDIDFTLPNTRVISVGIPNPVSSRLNFGGTLDCGKGENLNAYTCEESCCLVDVDDSDSGDATETDTPIDNFESCFFSFQNFDLSLVYVLYFKDTNNGSNYATIEGTKQLFQHYEFDTGYDYRFACITNKEKKIVDIFYAKYSEIENSNDVRFTFNSTKSKPEGFCFMIVGCMGYNNNENCTIGNIPLIESQVYINYMRTENFIYYFEKKSQANKQTGVLDSLYIYPPNREENSVKIVDPSNNSFILDNIDDIPIDKDLRETGTYIRLDVLFGLNIFQGLSQLVVGSRIEFLRIVNGRIRKYIYRVRKLEFIDEEGNKVDKYGNILKYRPKKNDEDETPTDAGSPESRMLYEDNSRILADNETAVVSSKVVIAVILTDPPLGTIETSDPIIFTVTKSENGHVTVECSGAGKCNRQTGQCECFGGYEGEACERMGCQNNCNNHGRCVAFYELFDDNIDKDNIQALKDKFGYFGNDVNPKFYGCKCEEGYRGPDCSLRECPSYIDPQGATNKWNESNNPATPIGDSEHRDCSGRGICDYKTGICQCHDGYTGAGCELMLSVM